MKNITNFLYHIWISHPCLGTVFELPSRGTWLHFQSLFKIELLPCPPPPYGPPKEVHPEEIFWKYHIFVHPNVVLQPWCQNMIFRTIKIMLACKIWVLYLQNQLSYVNFSFVKVMWNLNFAKFFFPPYTPRGGVQSARIIFFL